MEHLEAEGIIKKENVMYMKKKMMHYPGRLVLTPQRLYLDSRKQTVNLGGLLFAWLKKRVERPNAVFDLGFHQIAKIEKGQFAKANATLDITDKQNNTYRVITTDYEGWEKLIRTHMS